MKKLISIIAALSMIASLSVTSFAAIDVDVSDAATGTTLSYSEGSFTASITGNTSQDTIVVVKGDGNDISTTSIEYINQDTASQNFNFVLKNTPDSVDDFKADPADENETVASGATLTYTVLMGGDTVSKTEVGTITYTYTKDVVYYTVIFKDAAGNTLSSTEYEENTAVVIPADQTKAEDETYTYTFEGWKVEGAEDSTAVKEGITATGNLTYVPVFSATEKEVGGGDEGGEDKITITFKNGDTTISSEEYVANATIIVPDDPTKEATQAYKYTFAGWSLDGTTVVDVDTTATVDREYVAVFTETAIIYKLGDVNLDGSISAVDYQQILLKVKRKATDFPVGQSHTNANGTTFKLGDIDSNNSISAVDYQQVLLKVKRKATDYPVGTVIE